MSISAKDVDMRVVLPSKATKNNQNDDTLMKRPA